MCLHTCPWVLKKSHCVNESYVNKSFINSFKVGETHPELDMRHASIRLLSSIHQIAMIAPVVNVRRISLPNQNSKKHNVQRPLKRSVKQNHNNIISFGSNIPS